MFAMLPTCIMVTVVVLHTSASVAAAAAAAVPAIAAFEMLLAMLLSLPFASRDI